MCQRGMSSGTRMNSRNDFLLGTIDLQKESTVALSTNRFNSVTRRDFLHRLPVSTQVQQLTNGLMQTTTHHLMGITERVVNLCSPKEFLALYLRLSRVLNLRSAPSFRGPNFLDSALSVLQKIGKVLLISKVDSLILLTCMWIRKAATSRSPDCSASKLCSPDTSFPSSSITLQNHAEFIT